MPTPRPCRQCGKSFESTNMRQICCSLACSYAHKKKQCIESYRRKQEQAAIKTRPCRHCGVEFAPPTSGYRYCSEACQKSRLSQYKREHYQQQRIIESNKRKVGPQKGSWGLSFDPFESGEMEQELYGGVM